MTSKNVTTKASKVEDQIGQSIHGNDTANSSLKVKLKNLEEEVKKLSEELTDNLKDLQVVRSEKDTLQSVLQMKTLDVKKSLINELNRLEDDQKRHFQHQQNDNTKLSDQINNLKTEKTALQSQLLAMQRRINEVEVLVGSEDKL